MLDTGTYDDSPLIDPGLRAYHGPALLVKNNQVFADADFASLASIGDSRKRNPLSHQINYKILAKRFQVMIPHLLESMARDSTRVFIGRMVLGFSRGNGFSYWTLTENGPQIAVVQRMIFFKTR